MKVCIFGASGLVGRSLRHIFTEQKVDMIGTYHTSPFEGGYSLQKTDENSLEEFLKQHTVTHCINCVAERNVDLCEKQKEDTMETNCFFAKRLASVTSKLNIYFLHVSTDYVFDGQKAPYFPKTETNPLQSYGLSKREAEIEVTKENPNSCIVRVPVLYTQRYKTILETAVTMIGKKVMDKTRNYEEDNYFIRRPVFIDDLCYFIYDRIQHYSVGICHFYNSKNKTTKYEMAKRIGSYLEKDTSHISPLDKPSSLAGRPYDTQLLDNQYDRDIYPDTDIRDGIAQCFKKFKHSRIDYSTQPSDPIFFLVDLDGTLVDTDRLHYDSYAAAFQDHGYTFCSWEEYQTLLSVEEYCRESLQGNYNQVKETKNKYFFSTESISFMPGAELFLQWISQYKQNMVIVTNTSRQTVDFLVHKLPFLQNFHQWITREDVLKPKPHEEPYRIAKERFWKGESTILGFENTENGYLSLSLVTPIIYILCQENSPVYKKLYAKDLYFIPDFFTLTNRL